LFFFFQAEDGIRDFHVTGVQTCALPISPLSWANRWSSDSRGCYRRPIRCCFGHWNRPISIVAIRPPGALCCTASWRPEVSTGTRSEERRVGKEGRRRWRAYGEEEGRRDR